MPPIVYIVGCFIGLAGLGAAGWAWLRWRVGSDGNRLPVTAEWIEELSAERYRPMTRLLGGDDLAFLAAGSGYAAARMDEFRRRRAEVFRGYLRCLHTDFRRISMAIRVLMVQSRDDRPDLAGILLRRQMSYAAAAAAVRVQLTLYEFGICEVDTRRLVRSFEALRLDLRALRQGTAPTHA